jgi:hypothetical protein
MDDLLNLEDASLWDVLHLWALHNCPGLLNDPALFSKTHDFIHALLEHTVRREVRAAVLRAVQPSRS